MSAGVLGVGVFVVGLQRGGSWVPVGIGALLVGLITAGLVAYRDTWRYSLILGQAALLVNLVVSAILADIEHPSLAIRNADGGCYTMGTALNWA